MTNFGADPLRFRGSRRTNDNEPIGPVKRGPNVGAEMRRGRQFLLVSKYAANPPLVGADAEPTWDHEGLERTMQPNRPATIWLDMTITDEHRIFIFCQNIATERAGQESSRHFRSQRDACDNSRWAIRSYRVHYLEFGSEETTKQVATLRVVPQRTPDRL